ncbi:HAD-IA family hydrolase [Micromonospora sp. STR1s_5]|nr:HAD-IA family hydrolase [Micromonospora sp. STR1s_5]
MDDSAGAGLRDGHTPRLVIFDCDGVLVDSEILACDVQARALSAYGFPISGAEVARRFLGMSAKDMRAELEIDLGRPLPDDHETRCGEELFGSFRRELKPVTGIGAVIAAIAASGHACCVASSSSPERIALALDVTGLHDFFRPNVFSSTMVARGKPAPDLFLHAARTMGYSPESCIVVEDSANGIKAARSAGIRALGFLGGVHCPVGHESILVAAGADRICLDSSELALAVAEELGSRQA